MITAAMEKLEQGEEFQRIRARIKNTLNLPIDIPSKASGAPTDTARYVHSTAEPKDDLVTIFKRMLDLGSPDYEHQLVEFLHNGPPKMRYEYIKEEDRWEYHGKPDEDIKIPDEKLIAAVVAKVKEERETVDRARTNKRPVVINIKPDKNFDFQCYTLDCDFVTDDKKHYERHVVTCHYGNGLCYPGRIDIRMRGWTAQGKKWKI
jgi:hypothetical protein